MDQTTPLRHQHRVIVASLARLAGMINDASAADALAIGLGLERLTALLRIHFRQEDECLYPQLLASDDPAVVEAARAFQAEVGELWQQYELFVHRWPSHHVITADFEQFKGECALLFAAIDDRCRREDSQLFPVVEASRPARLRA